MPFLTEKELNERRREEESLLPTLHKKKSSTLKKTSVISTLSLSLQQNISDQDNASANAEGETVKPSTDLRGTLELASEVDSTKEKEMIKSNLLAAHMLEDDDKMLPWEDESIAAKLSETDRLFLSGKNPFSTFSFLDDQTNSIDNPFHLPNGFTDSEK